MGFQESFQRVSFIIEDFKSIKKMPLAPKTGSDKNYLQCKCDSLNKQIDELVYRICGLKENEIKIVEGG